MHYLVVIFVLNTAGVISVVIINFINYYISIKYNVILGYSAGVQGIAGVISVLIFKGIFNLSDSIIAVIGLVSASLELLLLGISGFVGDGTTQVSTAVYLCVIGQ